MATNIFRIFKRSSEKIFSYRLKKRLKINANVREISSISSSTEDWNKAVMNAEKIVGYPTSYLNLRCLLSDEMSNIALSVRKIVGTGHPLLKTLKNLIYNGRDNVQARGLIVLLLSKAASNLQDVEDRQMTSYGVMKEQRTLAEIVEMIHMAFQIHKGVANLSSATHPDHTVFQDMHFGNKIAVLCGDYFLSNACTGLAALKNTQVVDLMALSISNITESEFMDKWDQHGRNILQEHHTIDHWLTKNTLAVGCLMANSCKAALELSGHNETTKEFAYQFGKYTALAWQAHAELQTFIDDDHFPPGTPLDLTSSPIIFHQQSDSDFAKYVQQQQHSLEAVDYKKIRESVLSGNGIKKTQEFYQELAKEALEALEYFPKSDAKIALQNVLHAL